MTSTNDHKIPMSPGGVVVLVGTLATAYLVGLDGPLPFLADWDYRLGASRAPMSTAKD